MYAFFHKKVRATTVIFSLILCMAVVLSGCSKTENLQKEKTTSDNDKKLTFIHHFKTASMDPHNSWTPLRAGVVETLVRLNEKLEIEPWLATKWETKDNQTWVFTIRDNISFQDGRKLDASAVKASFERGVEVSKTLESSLKIATMEANGQELTIRTTESHPALPSELVNPYAAIINVEAERKIGREAFNHQPVGTGPFKVKQFTPNVDIVLERYEEYWDGKAKLNEVHFKFNEDGNVRAMALQSKEADIVTQIPAETVEVIQKDSTLRVESVPGLRAHFILYNQQKPLLKDVKVRKATDLLLDRQSIERDIMLGHGTPANGPFNTKLPFASQEPVPKQNIEEAKKLLQEAGFKIDADGQMKKDGKPLTLELITYKGRPELPLIAQLLQSDAAKAGMKIEIKTVENVDTYLRENKEWDLVTYSNLTAPRGDGGYFLNSALILGGSLNAANISSDKLSKIVMDLNRRSHMKERIQLTQEAVRVIAEETPHSYMIYPNVIVGMNSRITGWTPGPEEYYLITNKMDVK